MKGINATGARFARISRIVFIAHRRAAIALAALTVLPLAGGCLDWLYPRTDSACSPGELTDTSPATVSFADDIRPLLSQRGCLSSGCHGGFFPASGYDQRTYESMFLPGDEAQAFEICPIVPGDPESSYLMEKIQEGPRSGARMPLLRAPLSDEDIELIATWIREGARNN